MKKSLFFFILLITSISAVAQEPAPEDYFITTWRPEWPSASITIYTNPNFVYNYSVDWGDGNVTHGHTGDASRVYNSSNTYTIKISGLFPQFYNNINHNPHLRSIEQWGTGQWRSMARSFKSCVGLKINASDSPDLSQVTDMSEMFFQAGDFNGDLSGWDVSNVANMSLMFFQCPSFNQDLTSWNVGNVTNMSQMFERTAFNQDIGNWNVGNVTNMEKMFSETPSFNQDLGRWNVTKVTNMSQIFNGVALSTAVYDAILIGWSTQNVKSGVDFNTPLAKFCNAEAARLLLRNKGWTVWDGGTDCSGGAECTDGITTWNGSTWNNGLPLATKKVVFNADYNTAAGSIDACSIQINPGFTLTVASGTTIKVQRDLAINGNLIFESNQNGNGELGELGTKASVTGNATVHRYMKEKRSYRMVSPAVTTTTSIMENWQEGVHNTGVPYSNNQNPNPGFGTHITGSPTGANGFDATRTGNPSMYTVNTATQQFEIVGNTDANKLTAGHAYMMMVRGDRSIDLTNNLSFGETTLRAKGKLVWGKKHLKFVSPSNGAFVMFGNPYQSAVDINTVFATSKNVNKNFYYVYDPTLGANGAYVTVYLPAGNNNNGETVNVPNSTANQYLQSGQGAQLATLTAGAVTLDFQETDKAPGQFTETNATGAIATEGYLRGNLYTQENYHNGGSIHDGFAVLFAEGNNNAITQEDAKKPMNFYENLGINKNGTFLSIEKRALPETGETFPLFSSGYSYSDYVLKFELNGLEDVVFYLDDYFNGTSTLLEQGEIAYSFSIDPTDPESKATDRFSIRVGERLGVKEKEQLSEITFYPNPMGSKLNIGNPKNIQLDTASIYDLSGRLIKTMELNGATSGVSMDVSDLATATYMVVIKGKSDQLSKLMVKK